MSEPISRETIAATLKKHLLETIDGVTEETIDGGATLVEIGANSLDVVEIVSATMRDLEIKVPRADLILVETLDDLVDLLHRRVIAGEATQGPPPQ